MKKIIFTSVVIGLFFGGCGVEDLTGGSGSDSVSFEKKSDGFSITLKGINSDYVHVKYSLNNKNGRKVLGYGLNYKGKVVTDCINTGADNDTISYECTTKYDTSSPVGDPDNKVDHITLDEDGNSLYMIEVGGFGKDDKTTKIKTF